MSRTSIGRIVHDLWGGKSVRFKRVGKRGEKPTQGYINMRKSVGSTSTTGSINADGKKYSIDSIQAEVVLENWRAIRNSKTSLSFVRSEKWLINGNRASTEISVTWEGDDLNINVISLGLKRSIGELGLIHYVLPMIDPGQYLVSTLKQLATFLESSYLCRGIPYKVENHKIQSLKSPFSQGKIISLCSIEGPAGVSESRLVSADCKLLAPQDQCCPSCSRLNNNERPRQKRRQSRETESVYVNDRYLSENGLEKKVQEQRKVIKNCKQREERMKKEFEERLLSLEKDDHEDLCWIMENAVNDKAAVPPDMVTLWEQQKLVLKRKSTKGHLWHPQ